jgi:hypothetical protein
MLNSHPQSSFKPAIVVGFATALGLWCTWFITHLPWLGMPEPAAVLTVLSFWILASLYSGFVVGRRGGLVGMLGGAIASILGLLVLGSRLRQPDSDASVPNAGLIALGFVGTGMVIGLLGGALGGLAGAARAQNRPEPCWLSRFAIVAAASVAPLIFIGGLVTSTNSGMAVPDWPNTFGSNMFLYPLGPRARPDIYLEHAHRLFGTLGGLSVLTLAVWSAVAYPSALLRRAFLAASLVTAVAAAAVLASDWPHKVVVAFCVSLV